MVHISVLDAAEIGAYAPEDENFLEELGHRFSLRIISGILLL
jgi:hypothetical protein